MMLMTRRFQSTLPVGGATLRLAFAYQRFLISIHAPRGGSDTICTFGCKVINHFNPRSPWGERLSGLPMHGCSVLFQSTLPVGGATWNTCAYVSRYTIFQSTLPVGGATSTTRLVVVGEEFQSTLPVGGATTIQKITLLSFIISIHAPRGGSDAKYFDY